MGVPSWLEDPDLWNEIYVADCYFGQTDVQVDGEGLGNDIDVQKPPGGDGATEVDKGYVPCKPQLKILLYTEEHWEQYLALLATAEPKPGKKRAPIITVIHPKLQVHKKEKFRILKIHPLKKVDSARELLQIDLLEYFPGPKPTPVKKVEDTRALEDGGDRRWFIREQSDRPSKTAIGAFRDGERRGGQRA